MTIIERLAINHPGVIVELHVYVRRGRPERVEVEVWRADAGEGDVA